MHLKQLLKWVAGLSLGPMLAGCGGDPYALAVDDYNDSGPQRPAVIQISDPQVFARASLVNDRRREAELIEEFLKESAQLDFAKTAFKPQIRRQIESVRALAAELSVTVDPLKGAGARRSEVIGELDHELAVLDKQLSIEKKQKELTDLRAGVKPITEADQNQPAPTTIVQNNEAASSNTNAVDDQTISDANEQESNNEKESKQDDSSSNPDESDSGSGEANQAANGDKITALRNDVMNLQRRIDNLSFAGKDALEATPLERYDQNKAYRTALSSDHTAVSLDDIHDYRGNALYRLQFQASVMPGADKDKFGVARLTVLDPETDLGPGTITIDEYSDLYASWLAHVTRRLNEHLTHSDDERSRGLGLEQLGLGAGLFEIISLPYQKDSGEAVRIAIPPSVAYPVRPVFKAIQVLFGKEQDKFESKLKSGVEQLAKDINSNNETHVKQGEFLQNVVTAIGKLSRKDKFKYFLLRRENDSKYANKCKDMHYKENIEKIEGIEINKQPEKILNIAKNYIRLSSGLSVIMVAFQDQSDLISKDNVDKIEKSLQPVFDTASIARAFIEVLAKVNKDAAEEYGRCGEFGVRTYVADGREPPLVFNEYLNEAVQTSQTYAYSTAPVEQSQQISTTAKAAQSLELALAAAANLPQYGTEGSGALGLLRSSAGAIDAIERTPLVVGFSDRQTDDDWYRFRTKSELPKGRCKENEQCPQFGWVFGPKLRLNPEESRLELVQTPSAHRLFADVSLPAWWPTVKMRLDTAWIGSNWQGRGQIVDLIRRGTFHSEVFKVALPLNSSDLDALTSYLASRTTSHFADEVQIANVEPKAIGACAEHVTFLIEGANVWRSSEAYLAGIEGTIKVLPDMEGVTATFETEKIFNTKGRLTGDAIQSAQLTLWTRNGTDSIDVALVGGGNGDNCAASVTVAQTRGQKSSSHEDKTRNEPSISALSPGVISACADNPTVTISGHRLFTEDGKTIIPPENIKILLGTVEANTSSIQYLSEGGNARDVLSVTFEKPFAQVKSGLGVSMTIANKHGVTTAPIRLTSCTAPKEPKTSIPVSPETMAFIGTKSKDKQRSGDLHLLTPDGKLPPDAGDLRVGILFPKVLPKKWFESKEPASSQLTGDKKNQRLYGKIEIDQVHFGNDWGKLDKPQRIEAAILIREKKGSTPTITKTSGAIIYYPDQESTQLSIDTKSKSIAQIDNTNVGIEYPAFWETTFPGLKNAEFSGEIKGTGVRLNVARVSGPNDVEPGKRLKVTLKLGFVEPSKAKSELSGGKKYDVVVKVISKDGKPTPSNSTEGLTISYTHPMTSSSSEQTPVNGKKIFLIRHVEKEEKVNKNDCSLEIDKANSKETVDRLISTLDDEEIDEIYTSAACRTRQTASLISNAKKTSDVRIITKIYNTQFGPNPCPCESDQATPPDQQTSDAPPDYTQLIEHIVSAPTKKATLIVSHSGLVDEILQGAGLSCPSDVCPDGKFIQSKFDALLTIIANESCVQDKNGCELSSGSYKASL